MLLSIGLNLHFSTSPPTLPDPALQTREPSDKLMSRSLRVNIVSTLLPVNTKPRIGRTVLYQVTSVLDSTVWALRLALYIPLLATITLDQFDAHRSVIEPQLGCRSEILCKEGKDQCEKPRTWRKVIAMS